MYDGQDFEQEHSLMDRLVPVIGSGMILLIVGMGGWWIYGSMSGEAPPPKPEIQEVSLVKPPPPPPAPPEEEMEKPELEEEVEVPEPEKAPEDLPPETGDPPPPGTELGLDAQGGAGGDAFGLVGRKGGRSLVGGGGSRFGWYAGVVQQDIQNRLSEIEEVRTLGYTVVIKLWLDGEGRVQSTELERGTGDPEMDLKLRAALTSDFRLSEAPPEDLPQPIRLRISSRT